MATRPGFLAPQFETVEHQHETYLLGMWVFLMTELLLFGALFTAYAAFRYTYPDAFAIGSSRLDTGLGAINTVVLILSSLMMALAVQSVQTGSRKAMVLFLLLTMLFGIVFMAIKGVEYYHHYVDRLVPGLGFEFAGPQAHSVELFMFLYFVMTGVHAIHLIIGIALVGVMLILTWRGHVSTTYWTPVELTGLYWHFVDIVWIFLFPLLYLIRPA
ncbi:MAG TPA: cytochrome c oxidase subunit 3 family protein [Anaerolineae bacterium]